MKTQTIYILVGAVLVYVLYMKYEAQQLAIAQSQAAANQTQGYISSGLQFLDDAF
jgi:hypothetical protein